MVLCAHTRGSHVAYERHGKCRDFPPVEQPGREQVAQAVEVGHGRAGGEYSSLNEARPKEPDDV